MDADLDGRLALAHETALYFVAAEALTNVAKYAHASMATVTLRGGQLTVDSAAGQGTVVRARVPMAAPRHTAVALRQ